MLIGLDFDNTIVSYDSLFHKVAIEDNLITSETPKNKVAIRNQLRSSGEEEKWTELQGKVYGARMSEAEVFPGLINFLEWAISSDVKLAIVSHKTLHPFIGPAYNLHESALAWILANLKDERGLFFLRDQIFFELTKDDKLNRIGHLGCDIFIDDLPEILVDKSFPAGPERILFDPYSFHTDQSGILRFNSWHSIREHLISS